MAKRPAVLDHWDEVQHDPLTLPPDDFNGLTEAEAVELIREWFFVNFEDPNVETPYETAEGGYQYIWGGPYNTRDIIENIFADTASDELITAAIDSIEADGLEWVPHGKRRFGPEDDDVPPPDPAALHAKIRQRLEEIEELVAALPNGSANAGTVGIGHNHPPEPIDDEPLTDEGLVEVREAVAVLRAQPDVPDDDGKAAAAAAASLVQRGNGLTAWLARQGDTFVSEAVKEGGKEFGK